MNDEYMDEFIRRKMKEEDRVPDMVIDVPPEDVLKVLKMLDELQNDAERGKYHEARYKFWDYIHEMYPACIGKQCKINTSKPTELSIEVYSYNNQ